MKFFYIDKDIHKAETLHSDYYKNQDVFNNSIKKIFFSSWQLIGHTKQFNNDVNPMIFMPKLISEPLVLTKEKEKIYCLSNVCTHRAHMVCNDAYNSKSLRCPYHGRTFSLNGSLKNASGFNDAKNFPSSKDNLKNFKVKNWMDFIFISLGQSVDIDSVLNDIKLRVGTFPFDKLSFSNSLSNEFEIDVHWAIYCENYLEGFHVPFVHKGLSKEINNKTYETIPLKNGCVQFAKNHNSDEIYGYYYWIFPNIMMNFYDWGLSVNIIEPISKNKTRVRFLSYPILDNKKVKKEVTDLVTVEMEDQMVIRSVQKGIESNFYKRGRYSPKHEKGVHHFHRILSKYI